MKDFSWYLHFTKLIITTSFDFRISKPLCFFISEHEDIWFLKYFIYPSFKLLNIFFDNQFRVSKVSRFKDYKKIFCIVSEHFLIFPNLIIRDFFFFNVSISHNYRRRHQTRCESGGEGGGEDRDQDRALLADPIPAHGQAPAREAPENGALTLGPSYTPRIPLWMLLKVPSHAFLTSCKYPSDTTHKCLLNALLIPHKDPTKVSQMPHKDPSKTPQKTLRYLISSSETPEWVIYILSNYAPWGTKQGWSLYTKEECNFRDILWIKC